VTVFHGISRPATLLERSGTLHYLSNMDTNNSAAFSFCFDRACMQVKIIKADKNSLTSILMRSISRPFHK
jgi:hypothetical protein